MLLVGSGLAEGWGSQFRVTCLVLCSMKLWALLLKEDFDFELWCPTCVTDTGSAVPGHGQHLDFSFCSGWRAVLAPGDQRGPCRHSCSLAPLPGACRPLHGVFVPPPGSPCSPQNCCSSSERAVPPQGAGTSLPSGFSEDLGWGWVTPCETLCGDGENKAASVEQLGFIWEEFSL